MVSNTTIDMMLGDVRTQLMTADIPESLIKYALDHARDQMVAMGRSLDRPISHDQYEQTASTVLVWIQSSLAHERANANREHDDSRLSACDDAESVTLNWRMVYA